MIVTKIEEERKQKKKIYIDGEYAFFLYPKEMRQYEITVGTNLSQECFLEIKQEIILKRAKRKMLALLSKRDYTCAEVERKLRQEGYPKDSIVEAISYGMQRHYLDDEQYVRDYIACKKSQKSLRQIEQDLAQKGIASTIYQTFLDREEDDEEALREHINRYMKKQSGDFFKRKQKTYRYFMQRGYSGAFVRKILAELEAAE